MDDPRGNPDRADPLRSLSRAIARGASQVLQQHMRGVPKPLAGALGAGERRSRGKDGDDKDLTHRCEVCGSALPEGSSSIRKFCSRRCAQKERTSLERAARAEENAQRGCAVCKQPMPPQKQRNAVYCSIRCINAAAINRRKGRTSQRLCSHCGTPFHPDKPNRRFCCHDCSVAAITLHHPVPCAHCGVMFRPKTATATFCSQSCVAKAGHASGRLRHWPRKLTARGFDIMLEQMRPKRPYIQRLTPERLDKMLAKVARQG